MTLCLLQRGCKVGREGLQQLGKYLGIARDYVATLYVAIVAVEITYQTTGLLNQQAPGGDIPFVQADFPETIEASSGYIG